MLDAIFHWIENNYPALIWIVITGALVWKVADIYNRWKNRLEKAEKKIDELPCGFHTEQLGNYSSMRITLDSVNEQVTTISKWVMRLEPDMIDVLARKCSPRMMTGFERNLFSISGAEATVRDNEAFLLNEVGKMNPATPYDVEEVSLSVILANIANPMFNSIKNYIYYQPEEVELTGDNNEKRKVKISLNSIIQLMALEVRDRFLKAHPEIQ